MLQNPATLLEAQNKLNVTVKLKTSSPIAVDEEGAVAAVGQDWEFDASGIARLKNCPVGKLLINTPEDAQVELTLRSNSLRSNSQLKQNNMFSPGMPAVRDIIIQFPSDGKIDPSSPLPRVLQHFDPWEC